MRRTLLMGLIAAALVAGCGGTGASQTHTTKAKVAAAPPAPVAKKTTPRKPAVHKAAHKATVTPVPTAPQQSAPAAQQAAPVPQQSAPAPQAAASSSGSNSSGSSSNKSSGSGSGGASGSGTSLNNQGY